MGEPGVGIDLGTCFSSVGVLDRAGAVRFQKDPYGAGGTNYSIPSSALVNADGSVIFGERAESRKELRANATRYRSQFKRDLGSRVPYHLGDVPVLPDELTRGFVAFLAGLAPADHRVARSVLTVPAAYSRDKRTRVRQAARAAGLSAVDIVDEPVAALRAAQHEELLPAEGHVLVYDLGGGTFDVALIRLVGKEPVVLGSRGLADFGGTDIDRLIEQDFAARAGSTFQAQLTGLSSDDPVARAAALSVQFAATRLCRAVKHDLSYDTVAERELGGANPIAYSLTRLELEDLARADVKRTVELCRRILAEHGVALQDLSGIVLVGGAARMPLVRELLHQTLGRPIWQVADPELAVCFGATMLTGTELRAPDESRAIAPRAPVKAPAKKHARKPPAGPQPATEPVDPAPSTTPSGVAALELPGAVERAVLTRRLDRDLLLYAIRKLDESAPAGTPPATDQPSGTTATDTRTRRANAPATKAPATKAPATKTPVTKTPVTKTPATKTPATKTPATTASSTMALARSLMALSTQSANERMDRAAAVIRAALGPLKGRPSAYLDPDIPERKLRNTRAAFGLPNDEMIFALVDLTVFGSARKAMVFTRYEFIYRYATLFRARYTAADVRFDGRTLSVNGHTELMTLPGEVAGAEALVRISAHFGSQAGTGMQ